MNFLEREQFVIILFESGIRFLHVYAATMARQRQRQRPGYRMPGTSSLLKFAYKAVSQAVFEGALVRNSLIHWSMQSADRRSPMHFVELQQTASTEPRRKLAGKN
jgi:hypothetical protein